MKILPLNCGIYMIKNVVTGDFYIGQSIHINQRKIDHLFDFRHNQHHSPRMQNAYNKYGEDKFVFSTLIVCEPFELTRYEQALVDLLDPPYNMCKECMESPRGVKHSDEAKRKMSESRTGEKHFRFGKHLTEEHKKKLSDAKKGNKCVMFGKHHTQEVRDKIANANRGVPFTEERKMHISQARMGYHPTPEALRHFSEANKGKHSIHPSEETRKKMSISAKKRREREREERELMSCQMQFPLNKE